MLEFVIDFVEQESDDKTRLALLCHKLKKNPTVPFDTAAGTTYSS
jgi:hypothetical protein